MSSPNPLVGYNDNLEHRGQIYHVQTEDSGARRPHVITHLFADGGRIITTIKTSYAEIVGQPEQEAHVRQLMRSQHRGMMASLRDGELDAQLDGGPGRAASTAGGVTAPTGAAAVAAAPDPVAPALGAASSAALEPSASDPRVEDVPVELSRPAPTGVDELERAAATADASFLREVKTPPRPIPAAVVRKATPPTAGSYRIVGRSPEPASTPPAGGPPGMPPPRKRRYPQTNPGRLRAEGRSKGASPADGGDASALGVGPIPMPGGFGARFISERSLDEVLLELLEQLEQL